MVQVKPSSSRTLDPALKALLLPVALDFLLLAGSMLIAIQIRLQLPIGNALGPGYQAQSLALYALMLAAAALVHLAGFLLRNVRVAQQVIGASHPFRRFMLALGASAVLILALLPELSQLQLSYYVLAGIIIGIVAIAFPQRIYAGKPENNVLDDISRVRHSHSLIEIWLKNNIETRYSQTILGVLWIVLLPLSTALVLTVAFTQFLRIQLDVPFVCFFLSALVPYNLFSVGVIKSTEAVISKMGLITQIYFPREILVILVMGEALVDLGFTFISMLFINALFGVFPNWMFFYLPFLLVILIAISMGFMFLISAISVLVRDVPQLVSVALQLFFYLTPIIYPMELAPGKLQYLFILNPIASIVQGFRDVIVYARPPDPVTLYYPIVFAGVMLYFGYCVFKSIEDVMADML